MGEDLTRSVNIRGFKGRRPYAAVGRVRVYRNVHEDSWSIQQKGLVIGHADSCALYNATFHVSEAGRQRVLREGRKNVHAWIEGELAPDHDWCANPVESLTTEIRYNPYETKTFVASGPRRGSGRSMYVGGYPEAAVECIPVTFASHVHLGTDGRVRACGVR